MIKVHYFSTGWVQIKTRQHQARFFSRFARLLDVLADRQWSAKLPIGCWLIEHPEGLILVDTGENSHANDKGYQPAWHPFMRFCERNSVKPEEQIGAQLKARGFNPLAVKTVVMTHMHGDHAGGLADFPASRFVLSAAEKTAIEAKDAVLNGYLRMHYPAEFQPDAIQFNDGVFENFDNSHKLTADGKIRLVPTAGHTLGHLSVVVDMGDHYIFIGGDAAYSEQYLRNGDVDGVCADAQKHQETTAKIRTLCLRKPTITQFSHDPDSENRLQNRLFTEIA